MRYLVLWLHQESGTMMLVIVEAPTVYLPLASILRLSRKASAAFSVRLPGVPVLQQLLKLGTVLGVLILLGTYLDAQLT